MDYSAAQEAWQRYFRWQQHLDAGDDLTDAEMHERDDLHEALEEPGPELCFQIAYDLLGCTEPLPDWLYRELCAHEGNPEDAKTYHAAAVELLTDHVIDGKSSSTWVRWLYPIFVQEAHVRGFPCTREGFEAWLSSMTSEKDCQKAMRHWPPPELRHLS